MSFWDLGLGGGTTANSVLFGPFSALMGGGSGGGQDPSQLWNDIINQYSYKPQYTAQTEQGLYNLFNQTNGSQSVENIPFDIGLPTTGLYDALTRGIKQQYLGTPGGPEAGQLANTRSYYNNLGIPEYAANQERLGAQDMNNSLLDTAAKLNETQKDRLVNVLGLGANVGSNLYSQDLAQQRFNTGFAGQGAQTDLGLQQSINSANNSALSALGNLGITALGTYFGGPAGGTIANTAANNLNLFGSNPNAPTTVNQTGGSNSLLGNINGYGTQNPNTQQKSTLIK